MIRNEHVISQYFWIKKCHTTRIICSLCFCDTVLMGVINHDKYQGAKNFTLVAYAGANFTSPKLDLNEYVDTDG